MRENHTNWSYTKMTKIQKFRLIYCTFITWGMLIASVQTGHWGFFSAAVGASGLIFFRGWLRDGANYWDKKR
jgi:hypothetical protein